MHFSILGLTILSDLRLLFDLISSCTILSVAHSVTDALGDTKPLTLQSLCTPLCLKCSFCGPYFLPLFRAQHIFNSKCFLI
jgi:hypothetical protein